LVYKVNYRTARAIQRNPVSKKKKKNSNPCEHFLVEVTKDLGLHEYCGSLLLLMQNDHRIHSFFFKKRFIYYYM
jgi:hypothetical protein